MKYQDARILFGQDVSAYVESKFDVLGNFEVTQGL
jgi:hypothetical protein